MQKDECKRALLCIANMYMGLTPLGRGHNKSDNTQHDNQK